MSWERWDAVIIGAGVAGLSTAIWARRLGLSALVLDQAERAGGSLQGIHYPIADYPGLPPTKGRDLAASLHRQAEEAGAVIRLRRPVRSLDAANRRCLTDTEQIAARALVMATGLTPRRLGVPGESDLYRQGLVRRPSVDPAWFAGRRVAVIGGGDRAAENALIIAATAAQTLLIHRSEQLKARQSFHERLAATPGVELILEATVTAFTVENGTAALQIQQRDRRDRVEADAVCIYIGNKPNTDLLPEQVARTPDGYLKVDANGQTSLPGLYAVGDLCTIPAYQSLITAAAQGMVAAKHIALSLSN